MRIQDSLMAQLALIEYAERETNRHLHNMRVHSEVTSTPDWLNRVLLNSTNYMTESTFKVITSSSHLHRLRVLTI